MEWYIMNANGLNGLDVHLGMHVGDTYIVDEDCLEMLSLLLVKLYKDDPVSYPVRHYILTSSLLSAHVRHTLKFCLGNLDLFSHCVKLMLELSKPLDAYENAAASADVKEMFVQLAAEIRALLHDGMATDLFREVSGFVKQAGHSCISEPCLEMVRSVLQLLLNTLMTSPVGELDEFCSDLLVQGLDELLFYAANSSQCTQLVVPAVGIMWFVYGSFEWHGGPVSMDDTQATADDRRKRLIVRMLELGLGNAVSALQEIMLKPQPRCKAPDDKYYFWLIAYFLSQNQRVHIPLRCLKDVLSRECLGYLVYRSLMHWEYLMTTPASKLDQGAEPSSKQPKLGLVTVGGDEKQMLQVRLGLAVSALTSVLAVIKEFGEMTMDDDSVTHLTGLIGQVVAMEDLREMLLLFVRCYSGAVMPLSFLVAVVRLNHRLLRLAERFMECHGSLQPQFDMMHHVAQFATPRIMRVYSILARRFSSNDRELNDCVFTMMDHVARDVGRVDMLLQSEAIGTFMRLNSTNALPENCELAEYVLQAFLGRLRSAPGSCTQVCMELLMPGKSRALNSHGSAAAAAAAIADDDEEDACCETAGCSSLDAAAASVPGDGTAASGNSWSEQEHDDLFELYFKLKGESRAAATAAAASSRAESANDGDAAAELERVTEALVQRGHSRRSASEVAAQLRADGLLDDDAIGNESLPDDGGHVPPQAINASRAYDWEQRSTAPDARSGGGTVERCVSALLETSGGIEQLDWLSVQLSDVAQAKQLRDHQSAKSSAPRCDGCPSRRLSASPKLRRLGMAAVAFYSVCCNVDTPLVTYSEGQEQAVRQCDGNFHKLLVALGFRMPGEGLLFPRMPAAWSADEVVSRCRALGLGIPSQPNRAWRAGSPELGSGSESAAQQGQQMPEETLTNAGDSSYSDGQHEPMDVTSHYLGMTSVGEYGISPAGQYDAGLATSNPATSRNLWLLYMQPTGKLCK